MRLIAPLPWVVLASVSLAAACGNVVVDRTLADAAGVAAGSGAGSSSDAPSGSTLGIGSSTGAGGAPSMLSTTAATGGAGTGPVGSGAACSASGLLDAPIKLPGMAANLDLNGPNNLGLGLPAAEQIDCACQPVAGSGPGAATSTGAGGSTSNGDLLCSWGPGGEVWAVYAAAPPHRISELTLWPGYTGTLEATSPDGAHHFSIAVGVQIVKDGQIFELDWAHPAALTQDLTELAAALYGTYAPGFTVGDDCTAGGGCSVSAVGDNTVIGFNGLGLALWLPTETVTKPVPSVVNLIDLAPS